MRLKFMDVRLAGPGVTLPCQNSNKNLVCPSPPPRDSQGPSSKGRGWKRKWTFYLDTVARVWVFSEISKEWFIISEV